MLVKEARNTFVTALLFSSLLFSVTSESKILQSSSSNASDFLQQNKVKSNDNKVMANIEKSTDYEEEDYDDRDDDYDEYAEIENEEEEEDDEEEEEDIEEEEDEDEDDEEEDKEEVEGETNSISDMLEEGELISKPDPDTDENEILELELDENYYDEAINSSAEESHVSLASDSLHHSTPALNFVEHLTTSFNLSNNNEESSAPIIDEINVNEGSEEQLHLSNEYYYAENVESLPTQAEGLQHAQTTVGFISNAVISGTSKLTTPTIHNYEYYHEEHTDAVEIESTVLPNNQITTAKNNDKNSATQIELNEASALKHDSTVSQMSGSTKMTVINVENTEQNKFAVFTTEASDIASKKHTTQNSHTESEKKEEILASQSPEKAFFATTLHHEHENNVLDEHISSTYAEHDFFNLNEHVTSSTIVPSQYYEETTPKENYYLHENAHSPQGQFNEDIFASTESTTVKNIETVNELHFETAYNIDTSSQTTSKKLQYETSSETVIEKHTFSSKADVTTNKIENSVSTEENGIPNATGEELTESPESTTKQNFKSTEGIYDFNGANNVTDADVTTFNERTSNEGDYATSEFIQPPTASPESDNNQNSEVNSNENYFNDEMDDTGDTVLTGNEEINTLTENENPDETIQEIDEHPNETLDEGIYYEDDTADHLSTNYQTTDKEKDDHENFSESPEQSNFANLDSPLETTSELYNASAPVTSAENGNISANLENIQSTGTNISAGAVETSTKVNIVLNQEEHQPAPTDVTRIPNDKIENIIDYEEYADSTTSSFNISGEIDNHVETIHNPFNNSTTSLLSTISDVLYADHGHYFTLFESHHDDFINGLINGVIDELITLDAADQQSVIELFPLIIEESFFKICGALSNNTASEFCRQLELKLN